MDLQIAYAEQARLLQAVNFTHVGRTLRVRKSLSFSVQFPVSLSVRLIEERIPIPNDRLRDQNVRLRLQSRHLLDGRADGHDFDVAAADLVDEDLDADDSVGADLVGLALDVLQAIGPRLVDEAR